MSTNSKEYMAEHYAKQPCPPVDPELYKHASQRRKVMLRAMEKFETFGEVAEHMGINPRTVSSAYSKLLASATHTELQDRPPVLPDPTPQPEEPVRILCIGDTHASPDYSNERFDRLGEFAAEIKPDIIVSIGDWADIVSLNTHGSKLELEGARWKADVACTRDSLERFNAPLEEAGLSPRKVFITGNHENRINKFIEQDPRLYGVMGLNDLGFEEHGWEVHRFGEFVNIAGFRFVHHMTGKTGRAAALGTNYKKRGVSVVTGHTHTAQHHLEYFEGRRIHGIDLGCCIHPDMGFQENWSCPNAHSYWRGVFILDNAKDGDADVQMIRAESLNI